MELNEFPDSWIISKVDDLGELIRGISYKKEDASKSPSQGCKPILRANNINGCLNFYELVYVPAKIIREEQYIKKGDLIFAMSSGSKHLVGKSAPALNDYDGSYGAFCALFQRRKPCSPSKVRVHRLCRLNDSMLHPRLSCPTTSTKEVTNESISKISTNPMALPISYCVGAQIPFQDSNWQSCEDGRELRESLFRATKL